MKASDNYLKIVEWSKEDGSYVGTCPGVIRGGIHGRDEAKVYRELCQAVDEALLLYRKDRKPLPAATAGKEFSGKFVVRVDKELHKAAAIRALQAGESLNAFCQKVLRTAISRHAPRIGAR